MRRYAEADLLRQRRHRQQHKQALADRADEIEAAKERLESAFRLRLVEHGRDGYVDPSEIVDEIRALVEPS